MKTYNFLPILLLAVVTLFSTCKKREFDSPPLRQIPVGNRLTIDSLNQMFQQGGGQKISFTGDYSTYAVVTADEVSGNLYKNIYIKDGTGAINLRLLASGGLYVGDSIRVYLKGTVLSQYNGMLQIDSVDVDNNVIKIKTKVPVEPETVTIGQINSTYQSKLIKLENVQFAITDTGGTYADAIGQQSMNRMLEDCSGNQIIVRTSGYANFAGSPVAKGKGTVVAIVGVYNTDIQLYLRDLNDVNLNDARCMGSSKYLLKDFEDDNITSGGWSIKNVSGSINWATNSIGATSGSYYGQCSNYTGGNNVACETWLISPPVDLSAATSPVLTFLNAYKYTGAPLELYVSTDYISGLPATATWTKLNFTASSGNFTWVGSGNISLASYTAANVHIAFKYTGSNSDGSTWEIDDVMIE